jgi:hypothetical protein
MNSVRSFGPLLQMHIASTSEPMCHCVSEIMDDMAACGIEQPFRTTNRRFHQEIVGTGSENTQAGTDGGA